MLVVQGEIIAARASHPSAIVSVIGLWALVFDES